MEDYKQKIIEKYDIKDYQFDDIEIPDFTDKNGIILIVGTSGSGKSTILKELGFDPNMKLYDNNLDLIDNFSSPQNAEKFLLMAGLRSIPVWFKKPNKISNGERHRFEVAYHFDNGIPFIDEFTSIVDRNTAKSLSATIRKHFDKTDFKQLFIATPHRDVIEWLCPDYVYDTDAKQFLKDLPQSRPKITITIEPTTKSDWVYFSKHHYLDSSLNGGMHCYIIKVDDQKIGWISHIHGTGRDIKSYWRENRIVILPEWQGLGIGKAVSDQMGREYTSRGHRYFSKTAHPVLGEYRDNSPLWRATSTNHKKRTSYIKKDGKARLSKGFGNTEKTTLRDANRITYSHEFIGEQ